ncbi:ATP-grasp domain-containing protein [Clavibacter capsici]|uniref:ATP-grasp domain-containing protein n=1 Tax=Clavibacter capsici TaxID=1874630 RepID=UPI0014285013|nr:hypothetical protein [Clavibacter capsici]QIS41249.1 hypothetical protein GW571_03355 [Clavibacter capsici]
MTHVVLFRHTPRAVDLWNAIAEDVVILGHEQVRHRYTSDSRIDLSKVRFLESFDLPVLMGALRELQETHELRSVSTLGEEDMDTAGFLHEFFVTGPSDFAVGTMFKDKLFMRSALQGVVPQPRFRGLTDFTGTLADLAGEGFGILKPRRGAGGAGVRRLSAMEGSDSVRHTITDERMAEEAVVSDRMLTCDGMAVGGEILHFYVHEYDEMVLDSLHAGSGLTISTSRAYVDEPALIQTLFALVHAALKTLTGASDAVTPFHFEWFVDEAGLPVFCEVGRRFGGLSIPRLCRYAFDATLLEDYWRAMRGESLRIVPLSAETLPRPRRFASCYAKYRTAGRVVTAPTPSSFPQADTAFVYVVEGDITSDATAVHEDAVILELTADTHDTLRAKLDEARAVVARELRMAPA